MQIETRRFRNPRRSTTDAAFDVSSGIPGFPEMRHVALLGAGTMPGVHEPTSDQTLHVLDAGPGRRRLAFLCIVPWMAFPDYDIEIDEKALDIKDESNICVLALVTVNRTEGQATMSANLRAPIVVDLRTRRAHQLILSDKTWPLGATFATTAPAASATLLSVG